MGLGSRVYGLGFLVSFNSNPDNPTGRTSTALSPSCPKPRILVLNGFVATTATTEQPWGIKFFPGDSGGADNGGADTGGDSIETGFRDTEFLLFLEAVAGTASIANVTRLQTITVLEHFSRAGLYSYAPVESWIREVPFSMLGASPELSMPYNYNV